MQPGEPGGEDRVEDTPPGPVPSLADLVIPTATGGATDTEEPTRGTKQTVAHKSLPTTPRTARATRKTVAMPKTAAAQKARQTRGPSAGALRTPLPPPSTARLGRTQSSQSFQSATSEDMVEVTKGKGRAPVAGVTLLTPDKGTAPANVKIIDSNVVAVLHGMERQDERHSEDMAGLHLTLTRLVEQVDTVEERLGDYVVQAVENAVRNHVPLALGLPDLRTGLHRLEGRVEDLSVAHNHMLERVQSHWESLDSQVQRLAEVMDDGNMAREHSVPLVTPPVTPARRAHSPALPLPPSASVASLTRRARSPSPPLPPSAGGGTTFGRRTSKKPRLEGDARVAGRDYSMHVQDVGTGTQHTIAPTASTAKMDVLVGPVSWTLPDIHDDVLALLAPACAHVPAFANTVLGVSLDANGKWVRMAVTSQSVAKALEHAWRRHRPPQYRIVKIEDPVVLQFVQRFDVVFFQETHLRPEQEDFLQIPRDFELVVRSRDLRADLSVEGGGVAALVRRSVQMDVQSELCAEDCLVLLVDNVTLCNVYMPPRTSPVYRRLEVTPEERVERLLSLLCSDDSAAVVLVGDFNARTANHSANAPAHPRRSPDDRLATVDTRGRGLLSLLGTYDMVILNGTDLQTTESLTRFTSFQRNGNSVIDYITAAASMLIDGSVHDMVVHPQLRTASDHAPVSAIIDVEGSLGGERGGGGESRATWRPRAIQPSPLQDLLRVTLASREDADGARLSLYGAPTMDSTPRIVYVAGVQSREGMEWACAAFWGMDSKLNATGWVCANGDILQDIVGLLAGRMAPVGFYPSKPGENAALEGARVGVDTLPGSLLKVYSAFPRETLDKTATMREAQAATVWTEHIGELDIGREGATDTAVTLAAQRMRLQQLLMVRTDREYWVLFNRWGTPQARPAQVSASDLQVVFEERMNPGVSSDAPQVVAPPRGRRSVDTTPAKTFSRPFTTDEVACLKGHLRAKCLHAVPGGVRVSYQDVLELPNDALVHFFNACIDAKATAASKMANVTLAAEAYVGRLPPWDGRTLYLARIDPHLTAGAAVMLDLNAELLKSLET
ncbi:hypothetical protein CERSUDRAFT_78667, partial [Gelatoporia subvermispora B]